MIKILHASHQGARNIELTFSDGATGIWNAEALLQRPGPLLVPLRDDRDGDSANTGSMSPAGSDPDTHTAAALEAWIKFFKHWKEAQAMSDLSYPPVQQAMKKLQDLSRNEGPSGSPTDTAAPHSIPLLLLFDTVYRRF